MAAVPISQVTQTSSHASLSDEKRREFTDAFQALDKSGLIGPFELGILMRSLNHNPTDDDLNAIIEEYQVYEKGGVNLKEFLVIMSKRESELELRQKLALAFGCLSRDDNGFVDVNDLKIKMMSVGSAPYTEKEFEEFIQEVQMEPDGQLDYMAFIDLLVKK